MLSGESQKIKTMVEVTIDRDSGFCFGVVNAIRAAELELSKSGSLYCLGDLVHNNPEMARLRLLGLRTIRHDEYATLKNCTVLLRAHGEPPSTYATAQQNNIHIIDATCPVVLALQRRIHGCYLTDAATTQLVIYGKKGHAEVNGLVGQTAGRAIVIDSVSDLSSLDFTRDIVLFSQTTKSLDGFQQIVNKIRSRMSGGVFRHYDTICRQVANRLPNIRRFTESHDWIYFVAGKESSNGKMLYKECCRAHKHIVFVTDVTEIVDHLPPYVKRVGVCGATSTPKWLMEEVASRVRTING